MIRSQIMLFLKSIKVHNKWDIVMQEKVIVMTDVYTSNFFCYYAKKIGMY